MSQFPAESITALIDDYGLNTERIQTERIVAAWLEQYESTWIVKAIVEAVFRGRYQLKSVDDILKQWQRLGNPRCSFKPDFERERLKKFSAPTELVDLTTATNSSQPVVRGASPAKQQLPVPTDPPTQNYRALNPEELEPFHHHHRQIGTAPSFPQKPSPPAAPIQPPAEDPQSYLPQTSTISNNGASKDSVTMNPPPPRWWLLDKLKIAISGVEPDKTACAAETDALFTVNPTSEHRPSTKKHGKVDGNPFGKQSQPEGEPKIQNTAHQL